MTELKHYGILGMKWGVRRYQNPDGTLTEAGKRRRAKEQFKSELMAEKAKQASSAKALKEARSSEKKLQRQERIDRARSKQELRMLESQKQKADVAKTQADEAQRQAEVQLDMHKEQEKNQWARLEAEKLEAKRLVEQRKRELAMEAARIKQAKREARAISKRRGLMTNEELQARINRLKMEKELRELTNGEVNRGKMEVHKVLKDSGSSVMKNAVAGLTTYGIYKLFGGQGGSETLARTVATGKFSVPDYDKKKDKKKDEDE